MGVPLRAELLRDSPNGLGAVQKAISFCVVTRKLFLPQGLPYLFTTASACV